jgi:hypothetical protein
VSIHFRTEAGRTFPFVINSDGDAYRRGTVYQFYPATYFDADKRGKPVLPGDPLYGADRPLDDRDLTALERLLVARHREVSFLHSAEVRFYCGIASDTGPYLDLTSEWIVKPDSPEEARLLDIARTLHEFFDVNTRVGDSGWGTEEEGTYQAELVVDVIGIDLDTICGIKSALITALEDETLLSFMMAVY